MWSTEVTERVLTGAAHVVRSNILVILERAQTWESVAKSCFNNQYVAMSLQV